MKRESAGPGCRITQKGRGWSREPLAQPLRGRLRWSGQIPRVARSSQPWAGGHNPFGIGGLKFQRSRTQRGFTLVELMLVMAVLTIAVCISAPSLSHFFRGRSLDSQARMLVALTRHGQSRAVSEGLPIEMWVDAQKSQIGMEAEPSYDQTDSKAMDFTLEGNVHIEVVSVAAKTSSALGFSTTAGTATATTPKVTSRHAGLPRIRFLPDGSLGEDSPMLLRLTSNEGDSIWIAQSRSRLNYEIRTTN